MVVSSRRRIVVVGLVSHCRQHFICFLCVLLSLGLRELQIGAVLRESLVLTTLSGVLALFFTSWLELWPRHAGYPSVQGVPDGRCRDREHKGAARARGQR